MFISSRPHLFRSSLTKNAAMAIALVCSAVNGFAGPNLAAAASHSVDVSEYEEWGLEPPKHHSPSKNDSVHEEGRGFDKGQSQHPAPQPPAQKPSGDPVPSDLSASIGQATVMVIAVFPDGKQYRTAGWIVDAERGIVVTLHHMVDGAETIVVAFPQISGQPEGEMRGSVATLMEFDNKMDVAYLHCQALPQTLPSLTVAETATSQHPADGPTRPQGGNQGGFGGSGSVGVNSPVQVTSEVVGKWRLQHNENGTQLYIEAIFNPQGYYAMQIVTVDAHGQQTSEFERGTFTVKGNHLILQTEDGPLQLPFWFQNGMLFVKYLEIDTTFAFQRV